MLPLAAMHSTWKTRCNQLDRRTGMHCKPHQIAATSGRPVEWVQRHRPTRLKLYQ